eukprot:g3524.t1
MSTPSAPTSSSAAETDSSTEVVQLCTRLKAFYDRFIPEKKQSDDTVLKIAAKYVGKGEKLFAFLRKKYEAKIRIVEAAEVNFESPQFDAAKALARKNLQVPVPDAKPLDNLSKCRALLPSEDENYRTKIKFGVIGKRVEKKVKLGGAMAYLDVIGRIGHVFSKGPMSVLSKCLEERGRLRIRTRAIDGDRGVVVGRLEAFDKHMNMILTSVTEVFHVKIRGEDLLDAARAGEKLPATVDLAKTIAGEVYKIPIRRVIRTRMLVRGDMVVFIRRDSSPASGARRGNPGKPGPIRAGGHRKRGGG